jgi:hypothetical protein
LFIKALNKTGYYLVGNFFHFLQCHSMPLVCSFEMCADVPTIGMKIFQGLLVRHNTRRCCTSSMAFDSGRLMRYQ